MGDHGMLETNFSSLNLLNRGKVRDIYDLGERLLIVATDRISAFDCVLPNAIPGKGKVLTQLSKFWFDFLSPITEAHFLTDKVAEMPADARQYADALQGRSMLVKKADVFPLECVVRGYLAGSGWKEYQKNRTVCGIALPDGLRQADKLEKPLFTPSTKATEGHDENISFERACEIVGKDVAETLRDKSIEIYKAAAKHAETCGIILCDTKFEWGLCDGEIILIDEVLTPDSSRFWPADQYAPGGAQPSFDKQFVRDYLESLDWDKTPPAPNLPPEIIEKTSEKYREAFRRLTGHELA